jgi:hypothetical protein
MMSKDCSISQYIPSARTLMNGAVKGYTSLLKFSTVGAAGTAVALATDVAITGLAASLGLSVAGIIPPVAGLMVSQVALRYATPYLPESWQAEAKAATNFSLVAGGAGLIGQVIANGGLLFSASKVTSFSQLSQFAKNVGAVSTNTWNGLKLARGAGDLLTAIGSGETAFRQLLGTAWTQGQASPIAAGIGALLTGGWYLGSLALAGCRDLWRCFNPETEIRKEKVD